MFRWPRLTWRNYLIALLDAAAIALAVLGCFIIRFEASGLAERAAILSIMLPPFVLFGVIVTHFFKLTVTKWRFFSMPDLLNIVRASSVLAVALLALDYVLLAPNMLGTFFFGKITIALYWLLQMFFLGGPRLLYRYFRYTRTRNRARLVDAAPTILIGRAADAEVLLRAVESGAVKKMWPVGILSPSLADSGQAIRSVPVLGNLDDLENVAGDFSARGKAVQRLVMLPSAFDAEAQPESVLLRARKLSLTVSRLPSLDEAGHVPQLAPVSVEDLLLRPSAKIDYARISESVRGKSVVVTGGGGSIGSEICDRVATFGAERLLIIENSEPALFAVMETLAAKNMPTIIEGHIADIRDRARIFALLKAFKPDLVFHAAALKHVPILERDWAEGIKTNIFGSVNVADATIACKAAAMVMISTDKAIEPVSMLGMTKRVAEMYCQARDAEQRQNTASTHHTRMISVRFGNVLASNGSVVPKFKAQIEAGGPVTVTHPDMVRYFMTIREACDLVVTAASHALSQQQSDVAVYVLNMGQPVRIVELAERMIKLSGLQLGHDIEIVYTGIRPGERLHEILFAREEPTSEIGLAGIMAAKPIQPTMETMQRWLDDLERGINDDNRVVIDAVLHEAVPDVTLKPVEVRAGD